MIVCADARHIPLADGSVQCVVTSPPYFRLRDYQCGPRQIGLEATPDQYITALVEVFREARRVLRDDGVLWLVLGDSYWGAGGQSRGLLKRKGLIGIPWRVALALQADGWYLRSDIIWAKPNPMPESVTDRPTRSHEYIFLLTKNARYYYDTDAIREPHLESSLERARHGWNGNGSRDYPGQPQLRNRGEAMNTCHPAGRNKRDVWTVNSEPTPEAHFATFPQKLIEPCILAGSRMGDICFDPFLGSGTVGKVCERLGRRWVGLELSKEYIAIARRRTAQQGLRLSGAAK